MGGAAPAMGGMDPLAAAAAAVAAIAPTAEHPPSTVLTLTNMVTVEELKNDEDYEDIMLDTKEEWWPPTPPFF